MALYKFLIFLLNGLITSVSVTDLHAYRMPWYAWTSTQRKWSSRTASYGRSCFCSSARLRRSMSINGDSRSSDSSSFWSASMQTTCATSGQTNDRKPWLWGHRQGTPGAHGARRSYRNDAVWWNQEWWSWFCGILPGPRLVLCLCPVMWEVLRTPRNCNSWMCFPLHFIITRYFFLGQATFQC